MGLHAQLMLTHYFHILENPKEARGQLTLVTTQIMKNNAVKIFIKKMETIMLGNIWTDIGHSSVNVVLLCLPVSVCVTLCVCVLLHMCATIALCVAPSSAVLTV